MVNSWIYLILIPISLTMFFKLIVREDEYLTKEFGERYFKYKNSVPILIPRILGNSKSL